MNMKKDQMIKWGVIVGGGVLAYWYVTSYGPNGHVSTGVLSWWDTWFGAGTPAPAPAPSTNMIPQATPQSVVNQPAAGPVITAPVNTQVKQQILAASGNDQAIKGGYAIPDVWSYYWQHVTGKTISPAQMVQMFPPTSTGSGAPLNLDQFLSALPAAGLGNVGLGAIVSVGSAPSVPSMNFGGSFRKPGMRGMGGRTLPAISGGGSTIQ